jgi:hypothetical protein
MGLPLLLIFSSVGGVLGSVPALRGPAGAATTALLPFVLTPLERRVPLPTRTHEVHTSILIAADPATVWPEIIEVPLIQPHERRPALFTRLGFPHPLSATLSRAGVGGIRHARFERGLLFVETVTDWKPEHRLRFTIAAQPDSMRPETLDRHVTIGGPYFDVLSGRYEIRPGPRGKVLLELTSELRLSTHFNLYATPWVDAVMRSVQENILQVIRSRAEAGTRALQNRTTVSELSNSGFRQPKPLVTAHTLAWQWPRPYPRSRPMMGIPARPRGTPADPSVVSEASEY